MSRGPWKGPGLTRFRPVVEAAIRYRDASTSAEWRAARVALAVAVVRWAEAIEPGAVVEVLNVPAELDECPLWDALIEAVINYEIPAGAATITGWNVERRKASPAWHRLHHAAGRWASVAQVRFIVPAEAEGVSHAA